MPNKLFWKSIIFGLICIAVGYISSTIYTYYIFHKDMEMVWEFAVPNLILNLMFFPWIVYVDYRNERLDK